MSILHPFQKNPAEKKQAVAVPAIPAVAAPAVSHTGKKKTNTAWRILSRPLISEKAAQMGKHNQYVFVVALSATKSDVRRAVEETYGVRPEKVNMVRVGGKDIRYGRSTGTTKAWKKAMVTLPKEKTIQIYEGV
ncbi:50S ribosomal protein L23 [Candidatus Uhrbacteria bacterium]|nr:50S ribosomal protein L23 [Candidatus Uhrbacteria bacterium]